MLPRKGCHAGLALQSVLVASGQHTAIGIFIIATGPAALDASLIGFVLSAWRLHCS